MYVDCSELGGVLASVPFSGDVPLLFVRAVALMIGGQPKATREAFELIHSAVQVKVLLFCATETLVSNTISVSLSRKISTTFLVVCWRMRLSWQAICLASTTVL